MMFKPKCALTGRPCPKNNDPERGDYCPFWDEGIVWRNHLTGEERIEHCAARCLMRTQVELLKHCDGVQAAVEDNRNKVIEGFTRLAMISHRPQQALLVED